MNKDIARIDAWLSETGMAESRLGMLACANQYVIERIRAGTARIASLHAVLNYIKEHPPERQARS